MKAMPFVNAAVIAAGMLLSGGCAAIPTMYLRHEASVGRTYATRGSIKVQIFDDARPAEEKVLDHFITPLIWSANTSPDMMTFFQQTLENEARNTRLFNTDGDEFILSGNVHSMKVDRRHTPLAFLAQVQILAPLALLEFPKMEATVEYYAALSRNGKVVLRKHMKHKKSSRRWGMIELRSQTVSDRGSRVLDEAVTESIKMLFDEIDKRVR